MLHYPDEIIEVITASHRVMQVRRPFELEEQLHRMDDPNGICGVIRNLQGTLEDLYPWQLYLVSAIVTIIKTNGDIHDLVDVCRVNHERHPKSSTIVNQLMYYEADYVGAFLELGQRQMNRAGMDPAYYFGPDSPCRPKNRRD